MINDVFHIMRDSKREYKEAAVTESRTGEVIHLLVDRVCNVRIDVKVLQLIQRYQLSSRKVKQGWNLMK